MFKFFRKRSVSSIIAGLENMTSRLIEHEKDQLAEADRHLHESLDSKRLSEEASNAAAHARSVALRLSGLISAN